MTVAQIAWRLDLTFLYQKAPQSSLNFPWRLMIASDRFNPGSQ